MAEHMAEAADRNTPAQADLEDANAESDLIAPVDANSSGEPLAAEKPQTLVVDEKKEDEPAVEKKHSCPPCKPGAPLWMATFADMATLLMAFFVLILSFTEARKLKYTQAAGALASAFGVQYEQRTFEQPDGIQVLTKHYSASFADPTPTTSVEQSKTDLQDPDVELDRSLKQKSESDFNQETQQIEKLLAQYIARGQVEVRKKDNRVEIEVKGFGSAQADATESTEETLNVGGVVPQEKVELFRRIAEFQKTAQSPVEVLDFSKTQNWADVNVQNPKERAVTHKIENLKLELAREIADGLAEVERRGDQVIVRLSDTGAFSDGGADINTRRGMTMLRKVGSVIKQNDGPVSIEGHSGGDVLPPGGRYPSAWDLSIARAASVATALSDRFAVPQGRLSVKGYGDTVPRDGDAGVVGEKRKNNRIEIILDVNG
jgi:chemotaxis protein MotB